MLAFRGAPRRPFVQTFFLAPQEKGYYVLNDIFRWEKCMWSRQAVAEQLRSAAAVATSSSATRPPPPACQVLALCRR